MTQEPFSLLVASFSLRGVKRSDKKCKVPCFRRRKPPFVSVSYIEKGREDVSATLCGKSSPDHRRGARDRAWRGAVPGRGRRGYYRERSAAGRGIRRASDGRRGRGAGPPGAGLRRRHLRPRPGRGAVRG